jgi:hypothetical protein
MPSETIDEFCKSERISRRHYYYLKTMGKGPREMRLGRIVRITPEAKADWRREREAESAMQTSREPEAA